MYKCISYWPRYFSLMQLFKDWYEHHHHHHFEATVSLLCFGWCLFSLTSITGGRMFCPPIDVLLAMLCLVRDLHVHIFSCKRIRVETKGKDIFSNSWLLCPDRKYGCGKETPSSSSTPPPTSSSRSLSLFFFFVVVVVGILVGACDHNHAQGVHFGSSPAGLL